MQGRTQDLLKKVKAQKIQGKTQEIQNTQKHRRIPLRSPKTGRAKNITTRKHGRERIHRRTQLNRTESISHRTKTEGGKPGNGKQVN